MGKAIISRKMMRYSFFKKRVIQQLASIGIVTTGIMYSALSWSAGYETHPQAVTLIEELVDEHGFDRTILENIFSQAEKKQSILDAMSRPAEKTKSWKEYRNIFVTESRIKRGVEFWEKNRKTLDRAEQSFGVSQEIIVAIIGVETRYGRNTGRYRVIDALSTLAFDYPKRSAFFRKELKHFLILTKESKQDPLSLKGSYAGAMGYGQFIPSSYRNYAVDFDGDEQVDIWKNPVDAIGSVANYFKKHGWQNNKPVVSRVRVKSDYDSELVNVSLKPAHTVAELKKYGFEPVDNYPAAADATAMKLQGEHGAEFWLGLKNFYVITRYNHSRLYAMAVYQLSQAIKAKMVVNSTKAAK